MANESVGTGSPNLLGVTDEQAKAGKALADLGTTLVTEVGDLARYIGRVFGTVPEDAVGFVIGDPLHTIRTVAAAYYDSKVREFHERRAVKETQAVSLSVGIPLLRAAYDESRPVLQDIWAALIAAAMEPERASRVRMSFIDTVKRFDPLDALVLRERHGRPGDLHPDASQFLANLLQVSVDEVFISIENLKNLNCGGWSSGMERFYITRYGSALVRACSD
jgi:hypothetical protein